MSDLFCAATLIVARHGQAAYDVPDVASEDGGWLTPDGRRQARALGESLRDRRIASVWCSDMTRAVQTAEIAAGVLGGLPVTVRRGLREFEVGSLAGQPLAELDAVFATWVGGDLTAGCPGAETGEEVLTRMRSELESAADEHRGRDRPRDQPRRRDLGGLAAPVRQRSGRLRGGSADRQRRDGRGRRGRRRLGAAELEQRGVVT